MYSGYVELTSFLFFSKTEGFVYEYLFIDFSPHPLLILGADRVQKSITIYYDLLRFITPYPSVLL
jgi:hypothetical protein